MDVRSIHYNDSGEVANGTTTDNMPASTISIKTPPAANEDFIAELHQGSSDSPLTQTWKNLKTPAVEEILDHGWKAGTESIGYITSTITFRGGEIDSTFADHGNDMTSVIEWSLTVRGEWPSFSAA